MNSFSLMKIDSLDKLFEVGEKKIKEIKLDINPLKEPQIENNQKTNFSPSITNKSNNNICQSYRSNNYLIKITEEENEINNNNIKETQNIRKLKLPLLIAKKRSSSAFFLNDIYNKGTKSIELTDCQYIYSYKQFHPFSFMTGHFKTGFNQKKKILKFPSPTFIENDLWIKKPDLSKKSILKGMIIDNIKGLVLKDKEMTKKFKGIIGDIIKQFIKSIFGHKISLNVKLFEPKSILQTLTDYWSFIPKYFPMANDKTINAIRRMKLIMSFGVSGLYLNAKQLKPFNPLITETFQGIFENTKTEVYLEQISNYPTISRFYVKDIDFIMSGYYDLSVEMGSMGSKITALTKGYSKIDFININESITYILPQVKILNAISEDDRSAYYISVMIFYDFKNHLKGVIQFGKDNKCIHKIKGIIFEYKYKNNKIEYEKDREKMNKLDFNNLDKSKYKVKAKLEGSWLKEVIFDNEKLWDIDIDIPFWIKPVQNCLPSDCRFREDLIWLFRSFYCSKNEEERLKYENLAQEWKLIIEKLQRDERELKAKLNKIREKEKTDNRK